MEKYSLSLKKPIMICGLGHSGTSMVKNLLDGHPELYVVPPNELHFFRNLDYPHLRTGFSRLYEKKVMYKSGYETDMKKNIEHFLNHPYINRFSREDGFDIELFKRRLTRIEASSYKELYICLMKEFAISTIDFDKSLIDKVRYVVKSTFEEEYVPEFLSMFPDAKIVYVLRNPYAHFVSAKRNFLKAFGKLPSFHSLLMNMRVSYYWMEKNKRLFPDNFYILVYDRLLLDPDREIRELASFLEIEVHPILFKQTVLGRSHKGHTSFGKFMPEEIDKTPLYRWKKDISFFERALITRKFYLILKKYDFEIEGPEEPHWFSILKPLKKERPIVYLLNRVSYYLNAI